MILLNLEVLNKLVNGVSKEESRYYLNGIHIYDKDGSRYYEATDGHIAIRAVAPIEEDNLTDDYIIKMQSAVKSKLSQCELVIADKDTAVLKCDKKEAFDIIDAQYPDIDGILVNECVYAEKYTIFDPDVLKKLVKVYGKNDILTQRPKMTDEKSPAQWEYEDNGIYYTVIVMPMRVKKGGE